MSICGRPQRAGPRTALGRSSCVFLFRVMFVAYLSHVGATGCGPARVPCPACVRLYRITTLMPQDHHPEGAGSYHPAPSGW
eukprot:7378589-Prymnesium_polylepis.1